MKNLITITLRILATLILLILLYLEISSNYFDCSPDYSYMPIEELLCNGNYGVDLDPEKVVQLQALIQKRSQGLEITRQELAKAITLTSYRAMGNTIGESCFGLIFIASYLSEEAQLFRARQELEFNYLMAYSTNEIHGSPKCGIERAAKEYPIGYLQTKIYEFINEDDKQCYIFRQWIDLKEYINPFGNKASHLECPTVSE